MLNLQRVLRLALAKENLQAAGRFFSVYQHPVSALLQETGALPVSPVQPIKTPVGPLNLNVGGRDDLATISSMYCRYDYLGDPEANVVIDIGANVGIAAAYFLSRSKSPNFLYAYEPAPRNLALLRPNMALFAPGSVQIFPAAVGTAAGRAVFHLENTGKFGGLIDNEHTRGGETLDVELIAINDILEMVMAKHGRIDVLKVDTEGTERDLIRAIDPKFLPHIKTLFVDISEAGTLVGAMPAEFSLLERCGVAKFAH